MKKSIFKSFLILAAFSLVFGLGSCADGDETTDDTETTDSTDGTDTDGTDDTDDSSSGATELTDTDGNAVSSGTASISFSGTTKTLSAAYLIDGVSVEITSGEYASASGSSDQVVFLVVNGGSLTITGSESSPLSIEKSGTAASGGQVGDDYNFYGINSGIVVSGSYSSAVIEYAAITTSSSGSNAVVATNGAAVTISNSTITTTGSAGSRGLHCTYGGIINADNVAITTSGASCAALATDRGGGTITASNMTLGTNSNGSPLIYSTGTITASSSTGSANSAQMVVIEGGSSATLTNCDFSCTGSGNRTGTSESNTSSHTIDAAGIFIYQSQSGDSSDGTDCFTATGSTLEVTTSGVPMIYCTNITASVTLKSNTFTQASSDDYFLVAEEQDQWGTVGSNGGKVTFSLTEQNLADYKAFIGGSSSNSHSGDNFSESNITSATWSN